MSDGDLICADIQVSLCTEENRGDHAADIRIAHRVDPGETVLHLVERLMEMGEFQRKYCNSQPPTAWIELRVTQAPAKPAAEEEKSPWDQAPF